MEGALTEEKIEGGGGRGEKGRERGREGEERCNGKE